MLVSLAEKADTVSLAVDVARPLHGGSALLRNLADAILRVFALCLVCNRGTYVPEEQGDAEM